MLNDAQMMIFTHESLSDKKIDLEPLIFTETVFRSENTKDRGKLLNGKSLLRRKYTTLQKFSFFLFSMKSFL